MTLPFKQIPGNIRVPLFYAEVDPTHANTAGETQRALLIGPKMAAGTAIANVPIILASPADAAVKCGQGSVLALMADAFRANDEFGEAWLLPVDDAGGGVLATGTITVTAVPTVAGTVYLYIAGKLVAIPLATGLTTTTAATAIAAAINADTTLPVTAVGNIAVVTLTAKNKGTTGNDIDIRFNYLGDAGGEVFPTTFAATIVAMASGATNPTLTTALANLTDQPFDFIVIPWLDATSLNALQSFLSDVGGRWSYSNQLYGHVFSAAEDTFANRVTLGIGRNDQHSTIMGYFDSPTAPWAVAAMVAGQAAKADRADHGQPFNTLPLVGMLPPPPQSRDSLTNRNTLLFDGISTCAVDANGVVRIERLITTYQKNAANQADNSYLSLETMMILQEVLRRLRSMVITNFSRMKLADDGTQFAPGSSIVTPADIRNSIIALYREMEFDGLVQNAESFIEGLIVQRNPNAVDRIDVLWDGILINQLNVVALLAQFRQQ